MKKPVAYAVVCKPDEHGSFKTKGKIPRELDPTERFMNAFFEMGAVDEYGCFALIQSCSGSAILTAHYSQIEGERPILEKGMAVFDREQAKLLLCNPISLLRLIDELNMNKLEPGPLEKWPDDIFVPWVERGPFTPAMRIALDTVFFHISGREATCLFGSSLAFEDIIRVISAIPLPLRGVISFGFNTFSLSMPPLIQVSTSRPARYILGGDYHIFDAASTDRLPPKDPATDVLIKLAEDTSAALRFIHNAAKEEKAVPLASKSSPPQIATAAQHEAQLPTGRSVLKWSLLSVALLLMLTGMILCGNVNALNHTIILKISLDCVSIIRGIGLVMVGILLGGIMSELPSHRKEKHTEKAKKTKWRF